MFKLERNDKKSIKENDLNEMLNKLLEIEKERNKSNPFKMIIFVTGGVCVASIMFLLIYQLLNTDFSYESILSLLLAFFSMFISIFFYFKADETSTNFYKSSYDFMKDISVTLGKIEERFGEKLNSLNDKISHLDSFSFEKSEEIQQQIDDKDKIINELMDKANLDVTEKENYRRQLKENEAQIELLKEQQESANREATYLRAKLAEARESDLLWEPSTEILLKLHERKSTDLSKRTLHRLIGAGYMGMDGTINDSKIFNTLSRRGDLPSI